MLCRYGVFVGIFVFAGIFFHIFFFDQEKITAKTKIPTKKISAKIYKFRVTFSFRVRVRVRIGVKSSYS